VARAKPADVLHDARGGISGDERERPFGVADVEHVDEAAAGGARSILHAIHASEAVYRIGRECSRGSGLTGLRSNEPID
jgi:hypothetical protein